jgi:hypothetical protein
MQVSGSNDEKIRKSDVALTSDIPINERFGLKTINIFVKMD